MQAQTIQEYTRAHTPHVVPIHPLPSCHSALNGVRHG